MNIVTRQEAIKQGVDQYFTGKPCPYGHIAMRRVTGACCECAASFSKAYRKANPEKVKAWKSANQKKNRTTANERTRRWYHANIENVRKVKNAWAKEHPESGAAKQGRRRAAKLLRTPQWANHSKINRAYELAQEYRDKGVSAEVDHIIPLQGVNVSGLHVHNNLQILSMENNRAKSNNFKGEL